MYICQMRGVSQTENMTNGKNRSCDDLQLSASKRLLFLKPNKPLPFQNKKPDVMLRDKNVH